MIAAKHADQYPVRFPPGLRDRVKAAAQSAGRSMNTEIVMILERALASAAATTEGSLQAHTSAVALDETALAGGPINPR